MLKLPSPQADASLAYLEADRAYDATPWSEPARKREALEHLIRAIERRRELSDPRWQIAPPTSRGSSRRVPIDHLVVTLASQSPDWWTAGSTLAGAVVGGLVAGGHFLCHRKANGD